MIAIFFHKKIFLLFSGKILAEITVFWVAF